jgi:hypothetical protein
MFRATLTTRYLYRRHHPHADAILQRTLAVKPPRDVLSSVLQALSWCGFAVTYAIIVNWIYSSHLDLWDGTYGIEDDDEDDD